MRQNARDPRGRALHTFAVLCKIIQISHAAAAPDFRSSEVALLRSEACLRHTVVTTSTHARARRAGRGEEMRLTPSRGPPRRLRDSRSLIGICPLLISIYRVRWRGRGCVRALRRATRRGAAFVCGVGELSRPLAGRLQLRYVERPFGVPRPPHAPHTAIAALQSLMRSSCRCTGHPSALALSQWHPRH